MHPMLNTAIEVARTTGEYVFQSFERLDRVQVEAKGPSDFVTQVDRMAEQKIIEGLRKRYPDHSFLGEESGLQEGAKKDHVWVIDPIDGTTNFIHGIPHFAISIGLKVNNQLEVGVILNPVTREEFTAARGQGAQVNGRRMRVSGNQRLDTALMATGFPFRPDQAKIVEPHLATVRTLAEQTAGIRRFGSAALDLAYVAAGRYDAYWEYGLKEWDMAAGCLMVKEAGGLLGDLYGGLDHMKSGDIACATPKLFKPLLKTIHEHHKA